MNALREAPIEPTAAQKALTLFFITFLLLFPKGGVMMGGVPLTWGYLGLAAFAAAMPFLLLAGVGTGRISGRRLTCLALLVPFQFVIWLAVLVNGIDGIGFTISLFVTFFFVPLIFLLGFGPHLDRVDLNLLFRGIRLGVLAIAVYGIFLFVYRLVVGSFLEIPFLTVNLGDLGGLDDKHIDRDGIFKLISTYNNGNIYGICIVMLLPLYAWLERSGWKNGVVKLSLLLTLSRTVWAGLLLYELVQRLYIRRISLRAVGALAFWITLLLAGVGLALRLLEVNLGFLFDATLGGRESQWADLHDATLWAVEPFSVLVEMTYLSVLDSFGLIGLFTFVLAMAGPLLLYRLTERRGVHGSFHRAVAAGLGLYLFMALADGAILYIPVMAFYWFLASLTLSDNPMLVGRRSEPEPREAEAAPPPVPAPSG